MAQEYKLKLDSLELKDLEKQEVEVEGIEGAKVLLVKLGEELHALSSKCTHYGAPLVNGVVTPDGRLTCPWHGGKYVKYQHPIEYSDADSRFVQLASRSRPEMSRMHLLSTRSPSFLSSRGTVRCTSRPRKRASRVAVE